MKKFISIICIVLLVMQIAVIPAYAQGQYTTIQRNIHILGGSTIADVIVKDGTTLVAFDSLAFYLGADVGTVSGMQYMSKNGHQIAIDKNSTTAIVDKKEKNMPLPSLEENGRLYVPLSFVAESLGLMVYWRESNETIYVQSINNYQKASEIAQKSLSAVQRKFSVITDFINYTNISSDEPDRFFVKSQGVLNTDMKKNIAYQEETNTIFNGYYDSLQNEPVQTYVSKDALESWRSSKYITAKGIYSLTNSGTYMKEPVPSENISTMDMASKSIQTDPQLFLYSASIEESYDGTISVHAETDIGILLKIGFDIFLPQESHSLEWTETYQTIKYNSNTLLPESLELHLYANFKYAAGEYQKIQLDYLHNYTFDFDKVSQINLPNGME